MKKFNIERVNLEKIKLGEMPIHLIKDEYEDFQIKDGYLVDEHGERIGTKGDAYHKQIMDKIFQEGFLDHTPRPHYEDFYPNAKYNQETKKVYTENNEEIDILACNKVIEKEQGVEIWTPAHTLSVNNGIECSFDLSKGESPLTTLRPIATRTSIAEILWIYQKQSNDLVVFDELLGKNTWDQDHIIHNWWVDWAIRNEDGSYNLNELGHPHIGYCYGGTTGPRDMIEEEVIKPIKKNLDGRRNITCLWQIDDFKLPHGLKPCAFLTIWNVRHDWDGFDYLDMTLIQRSNDFDTAACINKVQYASLLVMVAHELGLRPGIFTWKPINTQIYDRHFDQSIEMLNRKPINCRAEITCNKKVERWEDFTPDDIIIEDYPIQKIKKENPQLRFPLGI